jgi:broad specificity phosphatase PhoE
MRSRAGIAATLIAASLWGAASAQEAVWIVRHAEKQTEANEPEVPLSEAGKVRAERLASLLSDSGVTAIYATATERARKTAEPLARKLSIAVRTYAPKDPLAARIRAEHPEGRVLVVGHSNTVPEILAAFGHEAEVKIASNEFDNLFLLIPKKEGPPTVLRLRY